MPKVVSTKQITKTPSHKRILISFEYDCEYQNLKYIKDFMSARTVIIANKISLVRLSDRGLI